MLRRIVVLFLLTAFTHVSAMTPITRTSELNKAFDELNYSLNVEWDQSDRSFFDAVVDDFSKNIAGLQENGMSSTELMDYTLTKIKDAQTRDEVRAIVDVLKMKEMAPMAARAFIVSKLSETYANGASWRGGVIGFKMAVLLGIIVIIALIVEHDNDGHKVESCTAYVDYACNDITVNEI